MKTFSIELDNNGVAVIKLDIPCSDNNRINMEFLDELIQFLNRVDNQFDLSDSTDEIKTVVILSKRDGIFCSGYELNEYLNIKTQDQGRSLSLKAQEIAERIENSRAPFVAGIDGLCFGMGLELVLPCCYRVASDSASTLFKFDDLELGLIPSFGTTQRLPQIAGITKSFDLILRSEVVRSEDALDIGLVNEVVPSELLTEISKHRSLEILSRKLQVDKARSGIKYLLTEKNLVAKKILFKKMKESAKYSSNSTAALMVVEAMEIGLSSSYSRGLHVESVYFGELSINPSSQNMIRVKSNLELHEKKVLDEFPNNKNTKINKVSINGFSEFIKIILSEVISKDYLVRLRNNDDKILGQAIKCCYDSLNDKVKDGELRELEKVKKFDLLSVTNDFSGLGTSELIIEGSRSNDLEEKANNLAGIYKHANNNSIIIVSSEVLRISEISSRLENRGNIIGVNPILYRDGSSFIELVVTEYTSPEILSRGVNFFMNLDKIPIIVRDNIGFFTTRVLFAYLCEALNFLERGIEISQIDNSMKKFGFNQGPFSIIDEIGLDNYLTISNRLENSFGRRFKVPSFFIKLAQSGMAGKLNKHSFYKYSSGKNRVNKSIYDFLSRMHSFELSDHEIQRGLLLRMINEVCLNLEDGTISSPVEADLAAVYRIGFPRRLGGPLRYIDEVGADRVLYEMSKACTSSIEPARIIRESAVNGKNFYDI